MSLGLSGEVAMSFAHQPVMLHEVVELIGAAQPEWIVDCTLGGGGHARALLEACPQARLLGLDRDPAALAAAAALLADLGDRVVLVHERFGRITDVLHAQGIGRVGAVLADLGVSSHQLDTAGRGFSFRAGAPLDMRMDPSSGPTAAELIAAMSEAELADAIFELGEERRSRRVARAIVRARPQTTDELARVVRAVVPKARDRLDPATRTFQAIRMLVNRELDELAAWLAAVPEVLRQGGVAVAISFHSLEDRAVKQAFRREARGCICPPELPACLCGRQPTLEVLTGRPRRPGAEELARNPRAHSARLRAARRLARAS